MRNSAFEFVRTFLGIVYNMFRTTQQRQLGCVLGDISVKIIVSVYIYMWHLAITTRNITDVGHIWITRHGKQPNGECIMSYEEHEGL